MKINDCRLGLALGGYRVARRKTNFHGEQEALLGAASLLAEELRAAINVSAYRSIRHFPDTTKFDESETEGWWLTIGSLGRGQPRVQLWRDQFLSKGQYSYWVGFYARYAKRTTIDELPTKSPNPWRKPIRLTDLESRPYFCEMPPKLQPVKNVPFLEHYESLRGSWYGIYDTEVDFRVWRATKFVSEVVNSAFRNGEDKTYGFEGGRAHFEFERLIRTSAAARDRKFKDNFVCQICNFSFETAYGEIGHEYAEAHHKLWLSKRAAPKRPKIDDLITVCANCHRMLHRMEGGPDDVTNLKRSLRVSG